MIENVLIIVRIVLAGFFIFYFTKNMSMKNIVANYFMISFIIGLILVISELFDEDRRNYLIKNWYKYLYVGFKFPLYIINVLLNGSF